MIKVQKQKELIFSNIQEIFEKNGFILIKEAPLRYIKKIENLTFSIHFDFSSKLSSSFASNSMIGIFIKEVEDIITEVGFPGRKLDNAKREEWTKTVLDKKNKLYFNHGNPSHIFLKTEEDFLKWSDAIIKYLEIDGIEFAKHYSYLPNVLIEMDRLENKGKYWLEILTGGVDHIFRGLIISKLCNDNDYERKFKRWEEIICRNSKYEKWYPYLKKLKEKLATLKPIYNL